MDSFQLTRISIVHKHTRPQFGSVFSPDNLPTSILKYPIFYFCNTALSYQPGQHWILLYFPNKYEKAEYFDSLGKCPEDYNTLIKDFLKTHSSDYIITKVRVQDHNTNTCGLFCLFVSDMRCIGLKMHEIIGLFQPNNLNWNEFMATGYVKSHMTSLNG